ncbi:Uncharacterised protein [uncultured archaeon]|nr:Uncharacterised protein [uncultured archaeon]
MKKRRDKFRFSYNQILMIVLAIFLLLIAVIFLIKSQEINKEKESRECETDNECVASACCHPSSCVRIEKKPECSNRFCTMDCEGPLDCQAGHCGCINGKCSVVSSSK